MQYRKLHRIEKIFFFFLPGVKVEITLHNPLHLVGQAEQG